MTGCIVRLFSLKSNFDACLFNGLEGILLTPMNNYMCRLHYVEQKVHIKPVKIQINLLRQGLKTSRCPKTCVAIETQHSVHVLHQNLWPNEDGNVYKHCWPALWAAEDMASGWVSGVQPELNQSWTRPGSRFQTPSASLNVSWWKVF